MRILKKHYEKIDEKTKKCLVLLCITWVLGVALIVSVSSFFETEGKIPFNGRVRAEFVYVFAIFLIMIPALLIGIGRKMAYPDPFSFIMYA